MHCIGAEETSHENRGGKSLKFIPFQGFEVLHSDAGDLGDVNQGDVFSLPFLRQIRANGKLLSFLQDVGFCFQENRRVHFFHPGLGWAKDRLGL